MPHIKSSPTAGHTGRLKSNHTISPDGKLLAYMGATGAAKSRQSGTSSGNFLKDAWDGVVNWFGGGLGKSGTPTKKGGGFTGWISNALGSGEGMMGLSALLNVGGTFISTLFDDSAEKQHELESRKLDIYEELGREELRINEMRAKDAIRQTGIASTFMGWTNPIAAVEGIVEPTPGLVVGDAPTEVASNTGGIIGGGNQGMITQAKQRQV
jgi:hypothetical protein